MTSFSCLCHSRPMAGKKRKGPQKRGGEREKGIFLIYSIGIWKKGKSFGGKGKRKRLINAWPYRLAPALATQDKKRGGGEGERHLASNEEKGGRSF